MRIELITVGRELLIGRTLNTNAQWVGSRIARLGTMMGINITVDDDLTEISQALTSSLARNPEFIVVIGGLGPTPDDMTLRGVAKGLRKRMLPNAAALGLMMEHYAKRGLGNIELTPSRQKMATLPQGAVPLKNELGTAPGAKLGVGETSVFCLPGVPSEMKRMFSLSVVPEIKKRLGSYIRRSVTLDVEGVLESALAPDIGEEGTRHPGAYIKSHPRRTREGRSKLELDIALVGKDSDEVEAELNKIASEFDRRISARGGRVVSTQRGPTEAGA